MILEWICDREFPQTPEKKSHCLVRWYIRRLKYQKHFPIRQKRPKQEYRWNWMHTNFHPYLRSDKWRYIEGCRISFYSSEYLFRYFYYYHLGLYLYVRNFQTGPLDAWRTYLKHLISYVIVKDMCLPWLDKLTLVNGLKSYGVSTDINKVQNRSHLGGDDYVMGP